MPDREKVIKGIEHCDFGGSGTCYEKECPYYQSHDCTDELKNDILILLKEQEAVEPINSYGTFRCGNCMNIVGYNDGNWRGYQNNFCSKCGKAVKWDD